MSTTKTNKTKGKAKAPSLPAPGTILPERDAEPWCVDGKPRVGAGASAGYGSDSYPYTVVAVSPSGHKVTLQGDHYRVTKGSFETGGVEVEYRAAEPDTRDLRVVTRRGYDKDGNPRYAFVGSKRGGGVGFGFRRFYSDPHF